MFDEIGFKIKTVAQVFTWIGIVGSVIWGFVVMGSNVDNAVLFGILIIAIGSLASWLGSLTLYGFGQLIENTDILVKRGCEADKMSNESVDTKSGMPIYMQNVRNTVKQNQQSKENSNNSTSQENEFSNATVQCPACFTVQRADRNACWNCGAKLPARENATISNDSLSESKSTENRPVQEQKQKKVYVPQDHIPAPVSALKVKCLVCGEEQPSNREVCWTCGSRFIK